MYSSDLIVSLGGIAYFFSELLVFGLRLMESLCCFCEFVCTNIYAICTYSIVNRAPRVETHLDSVIVQAGQGTRCLCG